MSDNTMVAWIVVAIAIVIIVGICVYGNDITIHTPQELSEVLHVVTLRAARYGKSDENWQQIATELSVIQTKLTQMKLIK